VIKPLLARHNNTKDAFRTGSTSGLTTDVVLDDWAADPVRLVEFFPPRPLGAAASVDLASDSLVAAAAAAGVLSAFGCAAAVELVAAEAAEAASAISLSNSLIEPEIETIGHGNQD